MRVSLALYPRFGVGFVHSFPFKEFHVSADSGGYGGIASHISTLSFYEGDVSHGKFSSLPSFR